MILEISLLICKLSNVTRNDYEIQQHIDELDREKDRIPGCASDTLLRIFGSCLDRDACSVE